VNPISPAVKKAIQIGSICAISYLAVYIAKNILGAVSPQMIEDGIFTTEQIGTFSTVYFISYAVGQLINGWIGDRIKAKYMIGLGLIFAALSNFAFALFAHNSHLAYVAYGCCGFSLSMIYGPMTKVVAENVEPLYATRCSLGYTFASFFGSPLAGILASFLTWQSVFGVSIAFLVIMGLLCILIFTLFERKGLVEYGKYKRAKGSKGGIRALIRHRILSFALISVLTGVVRTTVVFWLPTYLSQYLGFAPDRAAGLFAVATALISSSAFIAVFIYERLHQNMDRTILLAFSSAALCFGAVYLWKQPVWNLIFMVLAILSSNCAASMLWSRYCPGLRDTGMVSGATGFLDFMSYMAAAASSTIFANAVSQIGWKNLILVWMGLMIVGVLVAFPYPYRRKYEEKTKRKEGRNENVS
jgi:OPA family glycerol-3-phosphate transporter-like MFS transporter